MTTAERIKERRQALDLSVDELADKLGKNRATVYRYESQAIENLPAKVLAPLAQALETTPGYLMGWTDDPYDYDGDPDGRIASIPDSQRRAWLELGLTNEGMWRRYTAMQEDAQSETFKLQDADIRAAFFNGADPTLTEEEQAAMWADVKEYIHFKIQQTRRKDGK